MTEKAERRRGRRGAAVTGMPCGVHKRASTARLGGGGHTVRVAAVAAAMHVGPKYGRDRRSQDYQYRLVPMTSAKVLAV